MNADTEPLPREKPPPWVEFARAPMVPIAVSMTLGLCADRYIGVPVEVGFGLVIGCLIGWMVFWKRPLAVAWLWVAFGGFGSVHHHAHRSVFPRDDIARFAHADAVVLTLRGVLADEPVIRRQQVADPLSSIRRFDLDLCSLEVVEVQTASGWEPASGRVRLWVERDLPTSPPLNGIRSGDVVQVVGRFTIPQTPGNPGERDAYDLSLDRRIRGDLRVGDTSAAVVRLDTGGWSLTRALAWLRGYSTATIENKLGGSHAPIGRALLLGDGTAMDQSEWDQFVRTGVVHVLVISGQHLVLLAAFVWLVLELAGVPRRRAAWFVAAVVFGYALLTGMRPSALRAAVMVSSMCGAIILRRPVMVSNSFALAWLVVIGVNPTDAFDLGCRLSFLSVFALVWGVGRWAAPRPLTPLERLVEETRGWTEHLVRKVIRSVIVIYVINGVLFVVNAPLLIAEQNIVSPVSLLIGPPLVVLMSVALVCGFLLLMLAPVPILSDLLVTVCRWSLAAGEWCVRLGDTLPGGSTYLPGSPTWWLTGFYLFVAAIVLLGLRRTRWIQAALLIWVLVGLVPINDHPTDEFRVAFLAVGHGGCVVMETPDGRCLIYDTGTTAGPDAVRRAIAPYLWHRGIRRIDEVFISHADTDHFNGLVQLVRRFPIGRVSFTPSFAEKPTREVDETISVLKRASVEMRTIHAGQTFAAGEVTFEVLHPPRVGPPGVENERSLVLLVRHAAHSILLTGDLEKAGTTRVLSLPPMSIDVLQAPHHGSRAAFPTSLRAWAAPRRVLVSRGNLYGNSITDSDTDVATWDTHTHGAITVRSHRTGMTVETFRTKRLEVIRGR